MAAVKRTTTISEAITETMFNREPPILKSVSISRRRSRSHSINTRAAKTSVARPTTTAPATT